MVSSARMCLLTPESSKSCRNGQFQNKVQMSRKTSTGAMHACTAMHERWMHAHAKFEGAERNKG